MMSERQKLIAHKHLMQYVKNSLRQLVGIEVLEVYEHSENIDLNEMYEPICRHIR